MDREQRLVHVVFLPLLVWVSRLSPSSVETTPALVAQMVKNLPAVWETRALSLGREDPLEKEIATYSSILTWRVPWTEEPGELQSMGSQRIRYDE